MVFMTIKIAAAQPKDLPSLKALADSLGWDLAFVPLDSSLEGYGLAYVDNCLSLVVASSTKAPRVKPIYVDFNAPKLRYRLKSRGALQQELIVKAAGTKAPKRIVDATAGFGVDSLVLASAGFDVVMIERSAIMALLLADGLRRFSAGAFMMPRLIFGEARDHLPQLAADGYKAVYLDPMFPVEPSNSAKRTQRLVLLHRVVGDDLDADNLLNEALKYFHRTIVKRPLHAKTLSNITPSQQLKGRSCRFDVYFN